MLLGLFKEPIIFLFLVCALIIAISVHEFSHAWMANYLGDPTARFQGRLTLNPLAHLDPIGTLMIFLIGFGWGKPVPFNPYNLQKGKLGPALVAIAGPTANLITAVIFAFPIRLIFMYSPALLNSPLYLLFGIIIWLNVMLLVFNLIPIPPLDGSKMLYALLPDSAESFIAQFEQMGPFLLLILVFLSGNLLWTIMNPIISILLRFLLPVGIF
jgi:Zn-dependent protease